MFCYCLFLLFITSVFGDLTVDQYDQMINDFIEKTKSFKYPTSSRDFVSGEYDTTGCTNGGEYDFIIVGAGSAGTVMANRLSEVAKWKILLLEAGGEENDFTDIPYMFDYLRMSDFNWGYKSVPQKNSLLSFVNNSEIIPRGKVLGGTSVLNAMMYVRGSHKDYNKWGKIAPGWSYFHLLPYFKKSENATITTKEPLYHGKKGPLHVENINVLTPLTKAFLDANKELGRKILDYNGKDQIGASLLQMTETGGRRDSGSKAFLKPARGRKNLVVSSQSFVTKILMKNRKAVGVKYMKNSNTLCSYAAKEVILTAGALNSPQLLMLSGIGPREDLSKLGIPVVKDLPVGKNLWDHICMPLQPFTTNLTLTDEPQKELIQQYLQGNGVYTVSDAIQDVSYQPLYWSDKTAPDVEHIFRASKMPTEPYEYFKQTKNFNEDVYNSIFKPLEGIVTWSSYVMLLHPKSRGTVKLQSNSPFDFPLIDPQYLSDPNDSDLNTLLAGMKDAIKISKTKAMQAFDSKIFPIDLPNCRGTQYGSDDYHRCLFRNLANTIHHFGGTCSMGSVVGHDLKVSGVDRLRVVDCSVIPVTIGGHTNAVAYMIGEKGADLIKQRWLRMFGK